MRRKPALTLNFISIDDIFKLPLEFVELHPPSRHHKFPCVLKDLWVSRVRSRGPDFLWKPPTVVKL